ncbi:unnamed protein product [marine sediment metagenome]|uniref:Uncharacterized protein n=1 Tax=marine sediment metagenome TaxID=412755 RepID=X0U346_9ZZZZ
MDHGIAYAKSCSADVARAMHPVRIGGRGWWRPNMDMDVATVPMFDHTAVKGIRAMV